MFATKTTIALDSYAVRCLLPHRDVMALIDGVKQYDFAARSICAFKRVSQNEYAVQGYLQGCPQGIPGSHPMFPGTLVVEALAQASGLMMNIERLEKEGVQIEKLEERDYLATLPEIPLSVLAESHIHQRSIVLPGDTLYLDSKIAMQRAEFRYFKVEARTDERLIAKGTILLSYPNYM